MKISRRFTQEGQSPYTGIDFELRTSEIKNPDGSTVFRQEGIAVPAAWSAVATDILAQKYFRKSGVPQHGPDGKPLLDEEGRPVLGGERDARQVFHRLAGCWTHWGQRHGYFDSAADARAFHDELCHMLAAQVAAPNSPQWFNTGLTTWTRTPACSRARRRPTSARSPPPANRITRLSPRRVDPSRSARS